MFLGSIGGKGLAVILSDQWLTERTVVNPCSKSVGRWGDTSNHQAERAEREAVWGGATSAFRASGHPLQVSFPGPASEAFEIYLQRTTKVFPVLVPRQTPPPPQSFPEPQPGPPQGFQGPECEIQVTTLTSSVAATRSEPLLFVFPGSGGVCHPGLSLLALPVAQETGWASAGLRVGALRSHEWRAQSTGSP